MAELTGGIDVSLDLDTSAASAEAQRLQNDIKAITANLLQAQKVIENQTKTMTADIRRAMAAMSADSDKYLRALRREQSAFSQATSSSSRGNRQSQISDAAARSIVADAKASAEAVTARITNELVSIYGQKLKALDVAVAARLRAAEYQTSRLTRNNTSDLLAARQVLDDRRNQRILDEARLPPGQAAMRSTLERIGSNGGADIMAVQSRLLVGYQALSLAFNAAKGLSTFVVDLDQEFKNFQAITATTNSEMGGLKDRLIEVSEATRFTALEVAKAATVMAQAGLSAREVGDSMEAVTLLATAAGTDLNEAVDVVTSTMGIFNLQTSQTVDVANTLTAALNESKLTIDKVALGLQYSGNIAAQVGVSYQELVGLLGALANSGIRSGSTLGTGLRQLIIDITNPTEKLKKILKDLGLTEQDVNIESNGLTGVLRTLKEAGFGTSEAFEGLEVRAAAAYSALSNNLDLASKLQSSFILSSAAVEANAVQMESLANTYAKFQSIVGVTAYRAFTPVLGLFQQLINGAGDVLSALNNIPGLFEAIAVAAAGIGTAVTLSAFSALVRGLAAGIPVLSSFTMALATTATATTAVGVASGGAAPLVAAFTTALRANPIIAAISVLVALGVALKALVPAFSDGTEKIEVFKAQLNELNGDADATQSQVTAIDQAITNLLKQKEALDKSPVERRAKILEITQAFKELAGNIDVSTASVEDLINALNKLRTGDFKSLSLNYAAQQTVDQQQLEAQREAMQQIRDSGNAIKNLSSERAIARPGSEGWAAESADNLAARITQAVGSDLADAVAAVLGTKSFPEDASLFAGFGNRVTIRQGEYERQLRDLKFKQKTGSLTPDELETLDKLPDLIDLTRTLKEELAPLIRHAAGIDATKARIDVRKEQRIDADIQGSQAFTNLLGSAEKLTSEINAETNSILKNSRNQTASQRFDAFKALEDKFLGRISALEKEANSVVEQMVQESPDLPADRIRELAQSMIKERTVAQRNLIKTTLDTDNKTIQAARLAVLKEEEKSVTKQIQTLMKSANQSVSQDEIRSIEDLVRKKMDRLRQIDEEMFDAKIIKGGKEADRAMLEDELQETRAQRREQEQQYIQSLGQDSRDLQENHFRILKQSAKAEVDALKAQIRQVTEEIRDSRSPNILEGLVARWKELMSALGEATGNFNSLELQELSVKGQVNMPKDRADRAAAAMKFFMGQGWTQAQASGIVGNLLAESGLNPRAIGDKGQAFGIPQLHPDRQQGLRNFVGPQGNIYDFMNQLRFVDWELKNSPSERIAYDRLKEAKTAQDATRAFVSYERPKGHSYANPEASDNYTGRLRNALTLASQDYTKEAQDISDAVHDGTKAQIEAQKKTLKAASNAAVANANQNIQTLMSQGQLAKDPASLNKILESVNTAYTKIIDEKSKAFDAENDKGLKAGDEEIIQQRKEMLEGLRADRNQKLAALLEQYQKLVDKKLLEPVEDARAKLDAAKRPENQNRFSGTEIAGLEENVQIAERKAAVEQLSAAEEYLLRVRKELAQAESLYGSGSPEVVFWMLQQAQALERVNSLQREKGALDEADIKRAPSVVEGIQAGTRAFLAQAGIIDEVGKMIPLAKQVETTWTGLLGNLSGAFETLFMDLASGTKSAGDAFRAFGLSVVQSLMQAIAKALSLQIIMGLFGNGGSNTGLFGSLGGGLFTGLFGVPGMKLGGYMPGIKRSALGEMIRGPISTRDSQLRNVMPGEFLLRQSAVSAIGEDNLTSLNNLGNRQFADGFAPIANDNAQQGKDLTQKIYLVDDRASVPTLGPNDVVAIIADNAQRRGTIREVIKNVQAGVL